MDTEQYAAEWVKMMWDMDCINHNAFEDLDEATASLVAYLQGKHHDTHQFAEKLS